MNTGKEFEKYAVKHRHISSNTLDAYIKHNVTNLTPNIMLTKKTGQKDSGNIEHQMKYFGRNRC